eukprot:COSAG02_NODE_809_length_16922_cov_11.295013_11_plen_78_part_00
MAPKGAERVHVVTPSAALLKRCSTCYIVLHRAAKLKSPFRTERRGNLTLENAAEITLADRAQGTCNLTLENAACRLV